MLAMSLAWLKSPAQLKLADSISLLASLSRLPTGNGPVWLTVDARTCGVGPESGSPTAATVAAARLAAASRPCGNSGLTVLLSRGWAVSAKHPDVAGR